MADPIETLMARDLEKELAEKQTKIGEIQKQEQYKTDLTYDDYTGAFNEFDTPTEGFTPTKKSLGQVQYKKVKDPRTGKDKILALGADGNFLKLDKGYQNLIAKNAEQFGFGASDVVFRGEEAKQLYGAMTLAEQTRQAQIAQLTGEQSQLQNEQRRKARLGESLKLEEELRGKLASETDAGIGAIDSQLGRLLEDVGVQAGEAREGFGTSLARTGLSRSSMAQKGFEDIATQEVAGKGELRVGAEKQKYELQQNKIKIETKLKQIKDERARTFESANEAAVVDEIMKTQQSELQQVYSQLETNNQISAAEREAHQNLLGSIGKGLASVGMKIFSGGVL